MPEHDKVERFVEELKRIDKRKKKKKEEGDKTVWFGLGLLGLIGWSVAVPTVAGAIGGVFIDLRTGSEYSWTLMLMFLGLIVGCVNAWFWVTRERRKITDEKEEHNGR